jgi:RimJ/RimL family protein N-acetyltransferase
MNSHDWEFIRSCMVHPRIWPHISDDYCGDWQEFQPVMDDRLYYLTPEHDGRRVGVFFLHPHSHIVYEIHTAVLPTYWGPVAVRAARDAMRWMIWHTPCRKIVTSVPFDNHLALKFAKRVGMIPEGTNRASYHHNGELIDQHMLGITMEEIKCL